MIDGLDTTRRRFLRVSLAAGTGLVLGGRVAEGRRPPARRPERRVSQAGGEEETEVTALEDLMREHGILRRALLIYTETALEQISEIEGVLMLDDLSRFTAPPPTSKPEEVRDERKRP